MDAISSTRLWVNKVIVKYNICPFARREVDRGSIRYVAESSADVESLLETLTNEWRYLDDHPETETTLLVLSEACVDFDAFLDCVYLANHLLQMNRYEGVYQLAHFHPDYCFEGDSEEAASNYSNRSPFPTLHIIRESSMERAIQAHPDVDAIPERNIAFLNKKGSPFFADLLASCLLTK